MYDLCQEKLFPLIMNKLIMKLTISNSAKKHQNYYIFIRTLETKKSFSITSLN